MSVSTSLKIRMTDPREPISMHLCPEVISQSYLGKFSKLKKLRKGHGMNYICQSYMKYQRNAHQVLKILALIFNFTPPLQIWNQHYRALKTKTEMFTGTIGHGNGSMESSLLGHAVQQTQSKNKQI